MAEPKPAQAATWSWRGLMKGDPYSQGAPGKPMPMPPGGQPAQGPLGTQANPYRIQGQGGPGEWWQRPAQPPGRPGQFGFPQAEMLPGNIEEIRTNVNKWENMPTGTLDLPEWAPQKSIFDRFQGVFNMPQRGEDPGAPFDFNVGPQMASAPLGEGAGPSAPWAEWKPAQEEAFSIL